MIQFRQQYKMANQCGQSLKVLAAVIYHSTETIVLFLLPDLTRNDKLCFTTTYVVVHI